MIRIRCGLFRVGRLFRRVCQVTSEGHHVVRDAVGDSIPDASSPAEEPGFVDGVGELAGEGVEFFVDVVSDVFGYPFAVGDEEENGGKGGGEDDERCWGCPVLLVDPVGDVGCEGGGVGGDAEDSEVERSGVAGFVGDLVYGCHRVTSTGVWLTMVLRHG